jgi:hypothetical protein
MSLPTLEGKAVKAIEEHNEGCDAACAARRPNERESGGCGYQKHDGSLIYSRPCPECPKDWKIEWSHEKGEIDG